jgi:hypothetical protein
MRPLQELRAAAGALLAARVGAGRPGGGDAGLAWFPVLGAIVGAAATAADRVVGPVGHPAGAVAAAATLAAAWWRLRAATLGAGPIALAGTVEVVAAAAMPGGARTLALLLAPVFACWAMVVQCHGGTAAVGKGAPPIWRARFREFGWASVTALGCALVALDAVGLVVAIVAAAETLAVRMWVHRAHGGMTAGAVVATGLLVEATVLVVLAAIARFTA